MNGGIFGQTPFAQELGGVVHHRKIRAHEEFMAQVGVSETVYRRIRAADALMARASLVMSYPRQVRASDALQGRAHMTPSFFRKVKANDVLEAAAMLNVENHRIVAARDELEALVILNVENHRAVVARDALEAAAVLSANMKRAVFASDDLFAYVDVISVTIETDQINITIPPGGRLIFDTEHYTVSLVVDGVTTNVYRYHTGEFVKIDQNVIDVNISAGTGGQLNGFMTLLERYL